VRPSAAPLSEEAQPAVPQAAPADRLAIPPLNVSALVVTKADLVNALRIYVPQITDVAPLDGDRFVLGLSGAAQDAGMRGQNS
jgi:hypothetical protein